MLVSSQAICTQQKLMLLAGIFLSTSAARKKIARYKQFASSCKRALEKVTSASELLGSTSELLGSKSGLLGSTSELLGSIAMNVTCSSFLRACMCEV